MVRPTTKKYVGDIKTSLQTKINARATKTTLTNATKKTWYRGGLAHDNISRVKCYIYGASDHTTNVKQSNNADFTVNGSDNTKLIITTASLYQLTFIDGIKSKHLSRLKFILNKHFVNTTNGITQRVSRKHRP